MKYNDDGNCEYISFDDDDDGGKFEITNSVVCVIRTHALTNTRIMHFYAYSVRHCK